MGLRICHLHAGLYLFHTLAHHSPCSLPLGWTSRAFRDSNTCDNFRFDYIPISSPARMVLSYGDRVGLDHQYQAGEQVSESGSTLFMQTDLLSRYCRWTARHYDAHPLLETTMSFLLTIGTSWRCYKRSFCTSLLSCRTTPQRKKS